MPDTHGQPYYLTFIVDADFAVELKKTAASDPAHFEIESETENRDATKLGFDLSTVAQIATVISGTITTGRLAVDIYRWWSKSRAEKAIIKTPMKTLELHKHLQPTVEEIERFLTESRALVK